MKKYFSLILLLLLLSSCFWNNTEEEQEQNTPTNNVGVRVVDEEHVSTLYTEWNFKELMSYYEWIVNENSSEEDKLALASIYLAVWNAYYNEKEHALKALEILNGLNPNFDVLYQKWYANEIMENYEEARNFYEEALNLEGITLEQKATVLNQIWHVYDLEWDSFAANEYYMEAENTWVIFGWLLLNRWRYEYRNWNFDEAERYFIQLLELPMNAFIRSEVYFNLSSIYLNKQDEESVRQGIEYAKQWIEAQADYPFNHTNLWIGYLYAGELDNVLEPLQRALQLHPLSVQTAKFLWIYYYTVDDFENAIASFKLQLENADKDITLMKDEREAFRQQAIYDIARSYAWAWDAVNSISYLDMLLWTWENGSYYIQFLMDHALWGVFVNISETGLFQEALQRYAELYRDSDFNS